MAVAAGFASRSVSLTAFGVAALIEILSASAVLWRLWAETLAGSVEGAAELVEGAERGAARFIAVSFAALALLIAAGAVRAVVVRAVPSPGLGALALACAAALALPGLAALKSRAARLIGNTALDADAAATLACGGMAWALLAGLLAQRAGVWWADPAAALLYWRSRRPRGVGHVAAGLRGPARARAGVSRAGVERRRPRTGSRTGVEAGRAGAQHRAALAHLRRRRWGKTDQPAFLNQVIEVETCSRRPRCSRSCQWSSGPSAASARSGGARG